jgi:hypothetical protein
MLSWRNHRTQALEAENAALKAENAQLRAAAGCGTLFILAARTTLHTTLHTNKKAQRDPQAAGCGTCVMAWLVIE